MQAKKEIIPSNFSRPLRLNFLSVALRFSSIRLRGFLQVGGVVVPICQRSVKTSHNGSNENQPL